MLEVSQLDAWYGTAHVLHHVDLRLMRGHILGLVGRNGMGKSTLLRSVLGHVGLRSGTVRIDGRDVSRAAAHAIARLGVAYVPESGAVFGNLSVRENLLVVPSHVPHADGAAGWSVDRVAGLFPPLAQRWRHAGATLSGGEQRMLAIARALLSHPRLLVLDEAMEGLAPAMVDRVWQALQQVASAGGTVVVVDRDFRRLIAQCTHLCVLEKGRIVFQAPAAACTDAALAGLLRV